MLALRLHRALHTTRPQRACRSRAFCMTDPPLWEFVATAARSCKKSWLLAKLMHRSSASFKFGAADYLALAYSPCDVTKKFTKYNYLDKDTLVLPALAL